MAGRVGDLRFTEAALDKLGARGISERRARQLLGNRSVLLNTHDPWSPRRFLIGYDDGGMGITLVVEPTLDPTSWLVITGWEATRRERKMVRR